MYKMRLAEATLNVTWSLSTLRGEMMPMHLAEKDKKELLRIARRSIESAVGGARSTPDKSGSESLMEPSGVFVTLRQEGDLRGCIGYVEPKIPLIDAVKEVAVKAATEDPRFLPLSGKELDATQIEISVLSGLSQIEDTGTIEIGKHGLVIDAGFTRGLLLPGVAVEFHWTREQFLDHTAAKAGLSPEIWRTGQVRIFTFTTETFSES